LSRVDLCQPSIDILRDRCIDWFKRKGIGGPVHFPDRDELLFGEETREIVNVVFFGSFLKRFLESANWTPRKYRFWVLCESTRDVLTQLMGVPARQVGVIPRYELYPTGALHREFPKAGEPFTLVFAGRISPTKNIEALVRTVSFLQTDHHIPVRLALFGRFDNELHVDRNPPPDAEVFSDYEARIRDTIADCEWNEKPRLIQDCGPEEWYRRKLENPVLISLSTFLGEDFGVSIAQAQGLGWPCLLSDWGAHREVRGPGVRRVPASLIAAHETRELVRLKSQQLARVIRGMMDDAGPFRASAEFPVVAKRPRLPQPIRISELDSIRRDLVDQLGRNAHLICRGEIYQVDCTPAGVIFFSKYRQLFSGPAPAPECVVLVNNFNQAGNPLLAHIPLASRLILEGANERGLTVTYVVAKEIFQMDTLSQILPAKKIILPFFTEDMLPMALFLKKTLAPGASISVFARPGSRLGRLKGALGKGDRVRVFGDEAGLRKAVRLEFRERSC
jgi:glycosyltransferase involved in cell wall biosynthesis